MRIFDPTFKVFIVIIMAFSINLPYVAIKKLLDFQRLAIRKEVKALINAGLKDDELIQLKFSKSQIPHEITWEKADEFAYKGNMYDVVKTIESKDSLTYFCWLDEAENGIKQKLNEWADFNWHRQKSNHENKQKLVDFGKNLICQEYFIYTNDIKIVHNKSVRNFINSASYYQSPFHKNFFPPPEYID